MGNVTHFFFIGNEDVARAYHGLAKKELSVFLKDLSFQNIPSGFRRIQIKGTETEILIQNIHKVTTVTVISNDEYEAVNIPSTITVVIYTAQIRFDGLFTQLGYEVPSRDYGKINFSKVKLESSLDIPVKIPADKLPYYHGYSTDEDDAMYGGMFSYIDWRSDLNINNDMDVLTYNGPMARYGSCTSYDTIQLSGWSPKFTLTYVGKILFYNGIGIDVKHHETILYKEGFLDRKVYIDGTAVSDPVLPNTTFPVTDYILGAAIRKVNGRKKLFVAFLNVFGCTYLNTTSNGEYAALSDMPGPYDPERHFEARILCKDLDVIYNENTDEKWEHVYDIPFAISNNSVAKTINETDALPQTPYIYFSRYYSEQRLPRPVSFIYFSQDGTKFVQQVLQTALYREVTLDYKTDKDGKITWEPKLRYIAGKTNKYENIKTLSYGEETTSSDNYSVAMAFDYIDNNLTGLFMTSEGTTNPTNYPKQDYSISELYTVTEGKPGHSVKNSIHVKYSSPEYYGQTDEIIRYNKSSIVSQFPSPLKKQEVIPPRKTTMFINIDEGDGPIYEETQYESRFLLEGYGLPIMWADIRHDVYLSKYYSGTMENPISGFIVILNGEIYFEKTFTANISSFLIDSGTDPEVFDDANINLCRAPEVSSDFVTVRSSYQQRALTIGVDYSNTSPYAAIFPSLIPLYRFPIAYIADDFVIGNIMDLAFIDKRSNDGPDIFDVNSRLANDYPHDMNQAQERIQTGFFPQEVKDVFDEVEKIAQEDEYAEFDDLHNLYRRIAFMGMNVVEKEITV